MIGKRTGIDFEKHELIITDVDGLLIHYLKKPGTHYDSIKYINTNGIMAVTGDYSNWIFCREFHPSKDGYVESQYWREKLKIGSCQEPSRYDSLETEKEIIELLKNEDLSESDRDYLNELLEVVDDEVEYTYTAYRSSRIDWDYESIPFVKTVSYHFLAILDGFDEICRRLKEESSNLFNDFKSHVDIILSDEKSCAKVLLDAGIHNEDGSLHKNFGGK